jgi:hypothetical protein
MVEADSNADADAYPVSNAYPDADFVSNVDSKCYFFGNAFTDSDSDSDSVSVSNADADPNSKAYTNSDAKRDSVSNAYPNFNAYPVSDTGAKRDVDADSDTAQRGDPNLRRWQFCRSK